MTSNAHEALTEAEQALMAYLDQRGQPGGVGFDEYCMYEGPDKIKSHFGIDVIASGQREDIDLPDVRYWYSSMVQNGEYVEEDDIVRFDDSYGREGTNI